jgi:hypothetical protein
MEPHAVLSEYARKRRRARSSSDPVGGQVRDGDPLAGARTYVFDLRWLSPLIRRWKRAVGVVIFQLKMERTQVGVNLVVSRARRRATIAAMIANCGRQISRLETPNARSRTSSDETSALQIVPARRDLGGGMSLTATHDGEKDEYWDVAMLPDPAPPQRPQLGSWRVVHISSDEILI